MIGESRIAVVVPAHNEELLIAQVITTMPGFVDQIIVVDDASTDGTAAAVQAHEGAFGARLSFIRLAQNGGVGEAIVAGYRRALEDGNDVIAVMGGDAQMDPAELHRIVGPVVEGKCEYAKGNRFFWSETFAVMPRHRFLGNIGLSLLSKVSSGYWHIADFQSGYTAISAITSPPAPLPSRDFAWPSRRRGRCEALLRSVRSTARLCPG